MQIHCLLNQQCNCLVDEWENKEIPDILGSMSWCKIPRDVKPEGTGGQIPVTSEFIDKLNKHVLEAVLILSNS